MDRTAHPNLAFITTEPLDALSSFGLTEHSQTPVIALGLNGGQRDNVALPPCWTSLAPGDLIAPAQLKALFFEFLETWPRRASSRDQTFDELCTVDGTYSIWWTSVAAERQTTHGMFKYFRYAALVDRAIQRIGPSTIVLLTPDPVCTALVRTRCEAAGVALRLLAGCADERAVDDGVSRAWLLKALRHAVTAPVRSLLRALRCRRALAGSALFRESAQSVVIFASTWSRHLTLRGGKFSQLYWGEIVRALSSVAPSVEQAYLPRKLEDIVDVDTTARGAEAIRTVRAPLIVWEKFFTLRGTASRIAHQMRVVWRFYGLARHPDFRRSFRFANTDLGPVLIPAVRNAVFRAIDWSLKRAQVEGALSAAGNVRALVVSEELYRPAMPTLAAARSLGIPTVGVQHGNIMPMHFAYAMPRGHVLHAPVPDHIAVYGDFAKEVLSVHGAFPGDRVWVTGAARLDPLVTRLPDQDTARRALNLPNGRPIVVLATQTFPWFMSAVRGVLECVRDHPDVLLCVKRHSSIRAASLAEIDALAADIGVRNIRGFDDHADLLLAACSLWISASSTTLLEAMLIGRPTICVNFSGQPDRYPYVEEGPSLPARSVGELKSSFARVFGAPTGDLGDDRRRAFLRRHLGPTVEGRAAVTLAHRLAGFTSG